MKQLFRIFGRWLALTLLFLMLGLFFCQKIQFVTADLGRHIKNGEIFFREHKIPATNYYSFTEPEYPFINHHWGAGVVFYLIGKSFGFYGLSVFYTLILLIASGLMFRLACRLANFEWAYFFTVLTMPLLALRTEVRPEGFSYLFIAVLLNILFAVKDGKVSRKILWVLPVIELIWVNVHIFFIFGLFLTAVFCLDAWLTNLPREVRKQFLLVLVLSTATCFINPMGLKGFLEPFMIFRKYGYELVENQTVIFMCKRFPDDPIYPHFIGAFVVLVIGFILNLFKKRDKNLFLPFLVMVFSSAFGWKAIRGISLFGLLLIPFGAILFFQGVSSLKEKQRRFIEKGVLAIAVAVLVSGIIWKNQYYSAYYQTHPDMSIPGLYKEKGWFLKTLRNLPQLPGLKPMSNASAEFFRQNHLQGPIFNNYDIGSYLIFHLFPQEKVFVDNRPEAYSVEFFKNIYIRMQEDEGVWKNLSEKYHINVIYFYRHDLTPWAQPFLIRRVQDPGWVPVFVDLYTIILLKNTAQNAPLIQKYALPLSMFQAINTK